MRRSPEVMGIVAALAAGMVLAGWLLHHRHVRELARISEQHGRDLGLARELGALEARLDAAQSRARAIAADAESWLQGRHRAAAPPASWPEDMGRIRRELAEVRQRCEQAAAVAEGRASQALRDGLANLEFQAEVAARTAEQAAGQVREADERFAQEQRQAAARPVPPAGASPPATLAEQIAREYSERTRRVFGSTPLRSLPVFPRESPR